MSVNVLRPSEDDVAPVPLRPNWREAAAAAVAAVVDEGVAGVLPWGQDREAGKLELT